MANDDLEIDNLPNRLTILRVALIPVVIGLMLLSESNIERFVPYRSFLGWAAGWIFVAASITDFFDGYIARKRGIQTVFGTFLDPIADKFLVVSCLILLGNFDRIPTVVVIILVLREMYMTSLRLLATNEGVNVPVSQLGKWKTTFQMTAIPMLMVNESWWIFPWPFIGTIAIYIAGIISIYSAVVYSLGLIKKLKLKRLQKRSSKTTSDTQ
ncbi:MAG: CDP-diacylglycerol--glycerol-3-phosphate 3-phosphatidyltransferase [Bacteriovoracaceae bacterium]|nr:CDP-diacylglycerol--glycerol-3-phosphate 3-phosphatidyltransferase [Bacteriovoracaceae bacterium]